MKNKVLATTMAIGLTVVSAVSFVGCKGDKQTKTEIPMAEFTEVLKTSYDAYCGGLQSAENFKDFGVKAAQTLSYVESFEREHTPDGATEPVSVTYTEMEKYEMEASLIIKTVGDVLCLKMETAGRYLETDYYDNGVRIDEPLTLTTYDRTENIQLVFGVDNDVYYARVYAKVQDTKTVDGSETEYLENSETKFYKTFETEEDYLNELFEAIEYGAKDYINSPYLIYENDEILIMYSGILDIWKSQNQYGLELNIVLPEVDYEDREFALNYAIMNIVYTKLGPKSMYYTMVTNREYERSESTIEMDYLENVSLTLDENALDGYTETDFYADDYMRGLESFN